MPMTFNDAGRILYICDAETVPGAPYWKAIMALTFHAEEIRQADELSLFLDDDQRVLGVDMPSPVIAGIPQEAVLHKLREMFSEGEITELCDGIVEAERQMEESTQS